jgi:hypothetical protein
MMRLIKAVLLSSLFAACVPPAATYGSYTTSATPTPIRAVVVINGVELTAAQEDEFAALVGERLPPGRYVVTESGMMGIEGQPARVDLVAVIRARQGQVANNNSGRGTAIHNSNGDSHITSDGHGCTMLSTPTGSLSTGC